MPPLYRILTPPLRLTGRLHPAQLAVLVCVDALLRRARAEGRRVAWTPASLSGDLAGQLAVERELAREGLSRTALGRDAFVERVREYDARARAELQEVFDWLGVEGDLVQGGSESEFVARAAATAFVRLFDAGLLEQSEQVVDHCPRCETVVDPSGSVAGEVDGERLQIRLALADDPRTIEVETFSPELLPGVVAVAVGDDDPRAGHNVVVPLSERVVPVVAEPDTGPPRLLVPGHDAGALDTTRALGILPIDVIGPDGVLRVPGPLDGMARYAAKALARDLLEAGGHLAHAHPDVEHVRLCRRCATVLLPRLGWHWFLAMGELEAAAADAVRDGGVTFTPATVRDDLLERAGDGGTWCLSHQVWAGQPVPVAHCVDCGRPTVGVEPVESCGKCMGELVPDGGVLDARFVGAVWPLADAGWPADEGAPARLAEGTHLIVGPEGISRWALPMAALGLRLGGTVPFAAVTVHATEIPAELDEVGAVAELLDLVDRRVLRAALARGDVDLHRASAFVTAIDDPPTGDADVEALVEAYDQALAAAQPADAVRLLAAALDAGVRPGAADRLRALAAPILGD